MNISIGNLDIVPLYTILSKNQDTRDLANMQMVCKLWRKTIKHVSLHLLKSLNVSVDLDEATVKVLQITGVFKKILASNDIINIEKIRKVITKFDVLTQLKILPDIFSKEELKTFITRINAVIGDHEGMDLLKTILANFTQDLVFAVSINSQQAFLYILNHFPRAEGVIQEALYPACQSGNSSIVLTLIDLKADPSLELKNKEETYVTAACKTGSLKIVKALVEKGADAKAYNKFNEKPLALAARDSEKMFRFLATIDTNHDFSLTFGVENDKTFAHYAAEGNNFFVIAVMRAEGFNIDRRTNRGITPIMIAIRVKATETFKRLLKYNVFLNQTCENNNTPLDYAIICDNEYYIRKIIEKTYDNSILHKGLITAFKYKNVQAGNMILNGLGVGPTLKYVTVLGLGFLAGAFCYKSLTDVVGE